MNQSDLFRPEGQREPPAQRHSRPSCEASQAIKPAAKTLRAQVLNYLLARPEGATDEEIQDDLDMNPSTERPRRIELLTDHLIFNSGQTRETRSGRKATVWRAKR